MKITDNNIAMTTYAQKTSSSKTASGSFSESIDKRLNQTSVVDEYKKKHPDEISLVDSQVRSGEKARERYGANISTENMTMEEYKEYITGIMNKIPFDATRMNDEEVTFISEEGWEQMKNDPKYEAWVLGYTVQNRAVRNPFAAMGAMATFCVERFGASIEEHRGDGFNKSASGSSASDDEESWWKKRHQKIKELISEQEKNALKEKLAARQMAQQELLRSQFTGEPYSQSQAAAMAITSYAQIMDSFSASINNIN